MTRDDIIRIAQNVSQNFAHRNYEGDLAEFFNMAYAAGAAHERERNAKLCDALAVTSEVSYAKTCHECAEAIRKRK